MGMYTFECERCGLSDDYFFHMKDDNKTIKCERCGKSMDRIFNASIKKTETRTFKPYFNIGLGVQVDTLEQENAVDIRCKAVGLTRGHWDHSEGKRKDPGQKINDRLAAGGTVAAKEHAKEYRAKLKGRNKFRSKKPPPRKKLVRNT